MSQFDKKKEEVQVVEVFSKLCKSVNIMETLYLGNESTQYVKILEEDLL
jgi:hypothetical protein